MLQFFAGLVVGAFLGLLLGALFSAESLSQSYYDEDLRLRDKKLREQEMEIMMLKKEIKQYERNKKQ